MDLKHSFIIILISLITACSDSDSMEKELTEMMDGSEELSEELSVQLRECTSNHVMVGQTGELSTLAHSVSGTITIVNDCTIEITNFNYDGLGLVVEVYAGVDDNYFPPVGFALSEDLAGTSFSNETYTVQLPTNKTLDDLNGISIWCSDVGVSFGDSLFN